MTKDRWEGVLLFVLMAITVPSALSLVLADCRTSLGMQARLIPDHRLSSSSNYDDSVGPANARIRTESNGGAWCPKNPVSLTTYEFLEIDLGELKVVTMVETQGRFGNGQGQEFADNYVLEYQREPDGPWFRFRNRRGKEEIPGNMNTYIAELREVDPAMIARTVRFVPFSNHPKTVCMRVELYGCDWTDGSVYYNMLQGEGRGSDISLLDFTYDGVFNDKTHYLSGGLGQLMDGIEGQSNFRLDPHGLGIKGYDWIGWKNESFAGKPVEIIFKFDSTRNFTSMRIHCNNMFSKDVRVFKMAQIWFSIGGQYYLGEPVEFRYMRDTLIEFARPVIVPLHNHVGIYMRLLLYFDARWLMISEVQFISEHAVGNFTEEELPDDSYPENVEGSETNIHVINLIPRRNKTKVIVYETTNSPNTTPGVDVLDPKDAKAADDEIIGIVIGILATLITLLFVLMVIIIIRQKRGKFYNNRTVKAVESNTNNTGTMNLNDLGSNTSANGKVSNGKVYSYVASSDIESDREGTWCRIGTYREPADSIQHRKLPELPRTPESTDTNTSREYAVPDLTKSSVIVNIPPPPPPPRRPHNICGLNPFNTSPYYSVSEVPNIQGVSGNNLYAVPNTDMLWKEDFSVMEFPRENLKFIEKLGEGQFGEVHLCEAQRMADFLGDDFLINRTGTKSKAGSMRVVVKMLRKSADDHARFDFHREVKIMCRLKDPNIVKVLGVVSQDDPMCVIVEYMKHGDLNQFLKNHVPENTFTRRKGAKHLSYGCLIYMASQISSGMKYLETLNVVHRDLAARNCLVGHLYTIKISDFGMSRSLYSADYYRIEGRAMLPIRWMAWESVLLGKFSGKSDVWSFGVTLWEVLTFSREQPFDDLSDEQVIENCSHYFHQDGQQMYLPQPSNCPKEIFDLVKECWNREETDRPTFREIHMFLQRKNMGYNPKMEDRSSQTKITVPVV